MMPYLAVYRSNIFRMLSSDGAGSKILAGKGSSPSGPRSRGEGGACALDHTGMERAARVPFGSMISIFRQCQLTTVREAGGTGRRNEPDELVGEG